MRLWIGDGPEAPCCERTGLQEPGLGEGVLLCVADDEVVQDSDVEKRERLLEMAHGELVGLAGLGDSGGRVIVEEDHGGGPSAPTIRFGVPWP
jgi:hypothetical protein